MAKQEEKDQKQIVEEQVDSAESNTDAVDDTEIQNVETTEGTDTEKDKGWKPQQLIESNQQLVTIIAGVIVAIVAGYFGFNKFYLEPLEKEAAEQMYVAEKYFDTDSLDLAINGDGNFLGFIDIIDQYSLTNAGNLAKYYLGISYLKKGQYEDAIEQLTSFKSDDEIISSIAKGSIGDAYLELSEGEKAIPYYKEAAYNNPNKFTSPIYLLKLALAFENEGNFEDALNTYKEIKEKYKETKQGQDIDKFISRTGMKVSH